ncbi:aspartyl protease family protein [Chryseobacterium arachidis]|uniref:aspartyl protease family protein n=1 Tax=Chryseobacterium arachidis TaxID=1416778 RepID=UPI003622DFEB
MYQATTIPFELIDGKIFIPVDIKKEKHYFLFDTGAFTIISSELKGKINEKKSSVIFEASDAHDVKSKMDVFTTNDLQVSDLKFKNVNFSFTDVSWMTGRACKKISGILGANMMKGKVWRIDFKTRTISVFDKSLTNSSTSITIPFAEDNFTSVPRVKGKIRNQDVEFIFDSGSGMGITLSQNLYNSIKDSNFLTFEGLLSQGLNSINKGERYVDLMDIEFNKAALHNQIIDSSTDPLNLIGIRFIENYLIDLDFINNNIILNPTDKTLEYASFGISLAPLDNNIIVVNKLRIPSLSELSLGDKILKINGLDVSKIAAEKYCEIRKILDNSETIIIENDSNKKFTLEKENVLKYLN